MTFPEPGTRFFQVSWVGTIAFVQFSCYVEEWIFKQLPGFKFHWTVALVELLLFAAAGRLGQGRVPAPRLTWWRRRLGSEADWPSSTACHTLVVVSSMITSLYSVSRVAPPKRKILSATRAAAW